MADVIRIEGLSELQRAFRRLNRDLGGGVREALEAAAEPVRSSASAKAQIRISGMARSRLPWWNMRTGVTRTSVYIAPQQRGDKSLLGKRKRRNVARLLLERAMEPALAENRDRVEDSVLDEMDELFRAWERL